MQLNVAKTESTESLFPTMLAWISVPNQEHGKAFIKLLILKPPSYFGSMGKN